MVLQRFLRCQYLGNPVFGMGFFGVFCQFQSRVFRRVLSPACDPPSWRGNPPLSSQIFQSTQMRVRFPLPVARESRRVETVYAQMRRKNPPVQVRRGAGVGGHVRVVPPRLPLLRGDLRARVPGGVPGPPVLRVHDADGHLRAALRL